MRRSRTRSNANNWKAEQMSCDLILSSAVPRLHLFSSKRPDLRSANAMLHCISSQGNPVPIVVSTRVGRMNEHTSWPLLTCRGLKLQGGGGMEEIPEGEVERVMRVREVMLQAMSKKITWWQAAEILGVSVRTMRRWKWQYEQHGFRGIRDKGKGKPSWRKVPMEEVNQVLVLYREQYYDLNVRHFHEKLRDHHHMNWSYTWVKNVLQGAGLVKRRGSRPPHRKRRPRKSLPGMMLHIDGSHHQWFQDGRWFDLIVILDDATSAIYYAQLVDDECTRTVMAALRHVVENHGWFASIYSDRAGHFFQTPKAGGLVDTRQLTQ